MNSLYYGILIIYFIIGVISNEEKSEKCSGTGWVEFETNKCFKLLKSYTSGIEAQEACQAESAILAVINSQEEQTFLTNYIFNEMSTRISVWFGLIKNDDGYSWIDESPLTYVNWAEGNPTNETVKDCIEMISEFSRDNSGEWKDASCDKPNYVICEKLQAWTSDEFQKEFLKYKAEINSKLEQLDKNPVPIGFIYVQLKGQPSPSVTWPQVTWADISSTYSGLFFRVTGGLAADFGVDQKEGSPRLIKTISIGSGQNNVDITPGILSDVQQTGHNSAPVMGLRFLVSDEETRPSNTAMRIWKRTS